MHSNLIYNFVAHLIHEKNQGLSADISEVHLVFFTTYIRLFTYPFIILLFEGHILFTLPFIHLVHEWPAGVRLYGEVHHLIFLSYTLYNLYLTSH